MSLLLSTPTSFNATTKLMLESIAYPADEGLEGFWSLEPGLSPAKAGNEKEEAKSTCPVRRKKDIQ